MTDPIGNYTFPYFTEEHEMLRETLRRFIADKVIPNGDQWEKDGHVPREILREMGSLGLLGMRYPVELGGARVTPLPVWHGDQMIYGFRIDAEGRRLGYVPDCSGIPDATLELLTDMDAMILDGLRPNKHPTHFTIDECVAMLARIGARRSYITHLTHNSEHHALQTRLGGAAIVPWDGLEVAL